MKQAFVMLMAMIAATPAIAQGDDRRHITGVPAPTAPFSKAVLVGDTLYIAGHLGTDPKTGTVPADSKLEARLVMDAVKQTVEESGLTMDDVVSLQVFCTDLTLYDAFNGVYAGYFSKGFPARAFIGTSALVRGAHFEVLGVAVRQHARKSAH